METEARQCQKKMEARNQLPHSLIESEILPRLAAKSVARCMCVCKEWKSFLSTPTFARMHLHHATIDDYKLLLLDGLPLATSCFRALPLNHGTTNIPSNPNPRPDYFAVFILASLDGLVCLGSKQSNQLLFWNPLTGAYKRLSPIPRFDSSLDVIGFYSDSSHDYKLLYLLNGGLFGAYIYSHVLDSWREIEFSLASNIVCRWSPATSWGQCLYFTVKTVSVESQSWIICFDVERETFRKIQFPYVPGDARDYCGSLVVLGGCVHLCVSYSRLNMSEGKWLKHGDLWRIDEEDDGGWVKMDAFSEALHKFRRQCICTAGSNNNWLAVLDQEKNCVRRINTEDFTTHYRYFCSPSWEYRSSRMMYCESLVSPNQ